ncbi:MAG: beta-propeller fold lactonase family protein [Verrucomicrobia bacterium]|nr:beta-propeller fold lactonase family protein [Verrucomicrobiota bacterium]
MNPARRLLPALLACASALGGLLPSAMSAPTSSHLIFLGTYTKNGSQGIYTVKLDGTTGALSAPALVAETPDPAWITFNPKKDRLYAIHPSAAQAVGYRVKVAGGGAQLTPGGPVPPRPTAPPGPAPSHRAEASTPSARASPTPTP